MSAILMTNELLAQLCICKSCKHKQCKGCNSNKRRLLLRQTRQQLPHGARKAVGIKECEAKIAKLELLIEQEKKNLQRMIQEQEQEPTTMKKVYLSGRISSQHWEQVKKVFKMAAQYVEDCGSQPISPLTGEKGKDWKWSDYMFDDLKKLEGCDEMLVIGSKQDVKDSFGVRIEILWAEKLGIKVTYMPYEYYLMAIRRNCSLMDLLLSMCQINRV